MTPLRKLFFFLVFLSFFSSCRLAWARYEKDDVLVWKRIVIPLERKPKHSDFVREKKEAKGYFIDNNTLYFEYDSIRVYTNPNDSVSIKLLESGIIDGESFFSLISIRRGNSRPSMKVSEYLGWKGYNINIARVAEIPTVQIPKSLKNKLDSYKVFKVYCHDESALNPNSAVFQVEVINKNYKYGEKKQPLAEYLNDAYLRFIFFVGYEI